VPAGALGATPRALEAIALAFVLRAFGRAL
jgi:hypothetical protein